MKKIMVQILVLLPLLSFGQWNAVANYPTTGVALPFCFTVSGKAYMGCGYNTSVQTTVNNFEYNPVNNTWATKSVPPFSARVGMFSFSIGSYGYVGSGSTGGINMQNDFWRYDPSSDTWTQMAVFPGIGRIEAAEFVIAGKGYVVSGVNGNGNPRDCWQYDPATNSWSAMASPPIAFTPGYVTGFAYGNYGYAGIGGHNLITNNDFWRFDPIANTWLQLASLPSIPNTRTFTISGVDLAAGKGFVGAGANSGTTYFDFWTYDFVSNVWQVAPSLYNLPSLEPTLRTFNLGGEIYVGTGGRNGFDFTNKIYKFSCSPTSYGQSRGIRYTYKNSSFAISPNWTGYESSSFEIANDNLMVYTPLIQRGANYFSALSRFDYNLCYLGSKTVIENPLVNFYHGVSKNDGGFATCSYTEPYIIRNYDNQGNLLFCKKIIDSNTSYNAIWTGTYPKMTANPDNNNLYFAHLKFSNETDINIPNLVGSPLINVVEITPAGSVINSFQFKIPYDARYNFNGATVVHTWNVFDEINEIKYVKGGLGAASDRIWITINLSPMGSYKVDGNNSITNQQIYGAFPFNYHTAVIIATPYIGSSGGDAMLLLDSGNIRDQSLIESKPAQGFSPAQMMMLTVENQIPYIFKFNDHNYANPSSKYKFPFVVPAALTSQAGNLKNHQGTILFGVGKFFGIFNPTNLQVNLRQQNLGNATTLGTVNFNTKNSNQLYINYNNSSNGLPFNHIVKEDLSYFKYTCSSTPVAVQNAVTKPFTYMKLSGSCSPYSGFSVVNEPYTEVIDNSLIIRDDVCLRCCAIAPIARFLDETDPSSRSLKIVLHPNPTQNYFELTTELSIEKVEVYSMLGQMLKTFNQQNQYSITDLVKGSYILKITTTEGISTKTLIVE